MRILIACEESATVREAFAAIGHDAWSCDIIPSRVPGKHIQDDVLKHLGDGWDMMIAHPPCTFLTVANTYITRGCSKYTAEEAKEHQRQAIDFFMALVNAPIEHIAVENPVCIMSRLYRKPDQIIQPYQFGHPESKKTCLWLKNLPLLKPTKIMEPVRWKNPDGTDYRDSKGKRYSPTHYLGGRGGKRLARWVNQTASGQNRIGPSPDRSKIRAQTYQGIADAMAQQWGRLG